MAPASTAFQPSGDFTISNFQSRGPAGVESRYPFDFVPVTPTGAGAFNSISSAPSNDGRFTYNTRNRSISQGVTVIGTRINRDNPREDLQISVQLNPLLPDTVSPPLAVAQSFDLSGASVEPRPFSVNVAATLNRYFYGATAGTLVIASVGPQSIGFEFRNATFGNFESYAGEASDFPPNDGRPISTFQLNGTLSATGLPTIVSPEPGER